MSHLSYFRRKGAFLIASKGNIKGITLEINGEVTGLNSALSSVNSKSKDLNSELNQIQRLLKLDPTNTELLAQKSKVLADSVSNAKDKFDTLKTAAEQASSKLANGEIGEEQYRALQRELIKAEGNLNSLEKQANSSGNVLDDAGKQAKNSGDNAEKGSSGWSKLGNGISKTGELAGKAVLALGTAAMAAATGIGAMTVKAAENADEINTLSKQTGLSTDQIQKFQYASEQIDVSLDTLTGSMAKNIKSMKAVQDGTKLSVEAYEKLGVTVLNADGSLRDGQKVYNEVIDALGNMENSTERDAIAMQILGKSAQDLNPLILGGADALEELSAQAEEAGLILGQDALDNLNSFNDSIDNFKSTLSGSGSLFATAFAGPMANAMNSLTGYLQDLTSAFNQGGFTALSDKFGQILTDITNKISEHLPEIVEFGMNIIEKLVEGISQNLPTITQSALDIIMILVNSLLDMLPQLIDMGLQVIIQLALGIAQALPELIPTIVDTMLTIVETLIDNVDLLIDAAIAIIIALAGGIINSLPKLIEKAPIIIEKLVNAIIDNLPKLLEAAFQLISMLAKGIVENLPLLLESAGSIINTIVDGLGQFWQNIVDAGHQIVEGLWAGIKGAGRWLYNQVAGFIQGLINSVKSALGIHSPSRIFSEIGGNMSLGMAEGFTSKMSEVSSMMRKAIPTSFNDLGININSSYSGAGGTSSAGNTKTYTTNNDNSFRVATMNINNHSGSDFAQIVRQAKMIAQTS